MAKVKNFKTIFPAVSVPLNDDYSINEEEFRVYLRWIKSFYDKGIQGLVCNGHTGEITGLIRAERKRVTEICAEECGDIMTIISGVNCENTQESIEMAAEAKEAGADGILLMPPHMWLRFGMNPNAPFEYVKDVAEGAAPRDPPLLRRRLPVPDMLLLHDGQCLRNRCRHALICFSYGGSPTQLIFIANVLTSIATPTAGFFILRLIFRKDVNEGYGTPKVLQWGMVVCYVFACIMTISGLTTQIPKLLGSFGLM